jgi:hypothetical protein
MSQPGDLSGDRHIARPEVVTVDYLRDILDDYFQGTWNQTRGTVAAVSRWRDWPLAIRVPDVGADFTAHIDEGMVRSVTVGLPERPRILCIVDTGTLLRIYYEETAAAIECIAGRIKVRGNELERRRLLAAMSFLTW